MRVQLCIAGLLVFLAIPLSKGEEEVRSSPPNSAEPPTAASERLVYKPPAAAGNIPSRVSGAARGQAIDAVLIALVPNHVALTTQAQPSLFWFQSKTAKGKFELTVVEPKKSKPLVS